MLKLIDSSGNSIPLVQYENLMIESALEYDDKTLSFSMPVDVVPVELVHENFIRTQWDEFVIKEIDTDGDMVSVKAKLNIDELEGTFFESFNTSEQTITQAMQLALSGTGWTVDTTLTKKRTLKLTNIYVWDIVKQIIETYHVEIQIDSINKNITFVEQRGSDKGIYFTSQLNLKSISKKSDTNEFYTRIKPVGKDGLTIADVNNGKDYLENYQYSSKVKTYYWKDERYTVAESLMEDAAAKLNDLSKPYCAYSCEIVDLAANSDKYSILEYFIGDSVWLLDEKTNTRETQRIVKIIEYPDSPENNSCELANTVLTFEEYTQKYDATSDAVDNIMVDNGTVDGDCIDEIDSSKIVNLDIVVANEVTAQTVNITKELNAVSGKIGELETNKLSVTDARITYATIKSLDGVSGRFESFYVGEFKAVSAETDSLKTNVGDIKTLIFGSASGGSIQTQFSNSVIAQLGDAQIESAMIKEVVADKITGLDLNTTKFTVHSEDGRSTWTDNTIQISDAARVRVQIGKDATGDYNMYLWDKSGSLMFDALGLTEGGITRQVIRDDVVKDNANISASKLNIDSLFNVINEDGSHTLKSSKIYVDADKQTLDVSFKNMTTNVSSAVTNANAAVSTANTASANANTAVNTANTAKTTADSALGKANTNAAEISTLETAVSSQGTQITTIQGQITSKIWQQDITTAVSQIRIGGTQILRGTNTVKNLTSAGIWSEGTWRSASGGSGDRTSIDVNGSPNANIKTGWRITQTSGAVDISQDNVPVLYGQTYTVSCYAKWVSGTPVLRLQTWKAYEATYSTKIPLTEDDNTWKRYSFTFVHDFADYKDNTNIYFGNSNAGTLEICGMKLETGNTATDWTPAPEDTESSITTLSTQYSALDQTINSLSSTIASHTTQIATKADNSTVTMVSSKVTVLEQDLSGFKTTVSNTYTTKETFDALQIGGRNLLFNSNFVDSDTPITSTENKYGLYVRGTVYSATVDTSTKYNNHNTLKIVGTSAGNTSGNDLLWRAYGIYKGTKNFSEGEQYVFSFYAKAAADCTFKVRYAYSSYGTYGTFNVTTEWKNYKAILPKTTTSYTNQLIFYITTAATIYLADVKLEAGTIATDWTPAPEDTETRVTAAESSIGQLSNEIDLAVKETDITGNYLIGKINLTSTTAKIAAKNIELTGYLTISTAGNTYATQSALAATNSNVTTALNRATCQYGTCSTAAAVGAKVVTLSGFTLFTGAKISVKFTYANTVGNPTLNVNSTGAKTIYAYGTAISAGSPYSWNAGATVDFVYNGTQWEIAANSADGLIAQWSYKNNKTYINGAKLYTGTVTANAIATDAIKSKNYVVDSVGSFLNLADGSFDSKNLKWDSGGNLTASNATITGKVSSSTIEGSVFISKDGEGFNGVSGITIESGKIAFRRYTSSTQMLTNYLYANSSGSLQLDGEFTNLNVDGRLKIHGEGLELYHNTTPYIDFHYGNSSSDYTSRIYEVEAGTLMVSNNFRIGGSLKGGTLDIATQGNGSQIILHNDYDRKAYIRIDERQYLWFLPHTSSGYDIAHSASLNLTTGIFSAAGFGSNSSIRYKENIVLMDEAVADRLLKIPVYHYDYKPQYGDKDMYGVLAEEAALVHPNAVIMDREGRPDAIDYTRFIPLLIKKVQMQDREIKRLENIVAHLTGIAMQNAGGI